jgi:hypothetical protein
VAKLIILLVILVVNINYGMKKAILVGFGVLSSLLTYGQCTDISNDGIYVARVDSNTNAYLRFFGSDSVITTTSEIPKKLSQQHIIKEYKEFVLHGTYKKSKNCFIKMKLEGISGRAKLEGYMLGDDIGLSKINLQNNTYVNLFFFYKEY